MKKMMAFLLTAVMVLSMGTTAFGAVAKPSSDKVTRNGYEQNVQVYNIDGYNYFKLRGGKTFPPVLLLESRISNV